MDENPLWKFTCSNEGCNFHFETEDVRRLVEVGRAHIEEHERAQNAETLPEKLRL